MASFPHVVHHTSKIPDTDTYAVTRITPIVRISCPNGSVYLQSGKVLSGGGDVVKDLPAWFYEEVAKLTPNALREVGFAECPTPSTTATVVPASLSGLIAPAQEKEVVVEDKAATQAYEKKVGGRETLLAPSKDKA